MLSINIENKVAVVTGAAQGIGYGIAITMAQAGCDIAACSRSAKETDHVQQLIAEVEALGRRIFYKPTDVCCEESISAFIDESTEELGRIDYLISNAGANRFTTPENCSTEFWDENHDLNLKSHWLISKACHEQLRKNKGSIILMTSNHAYATLPNCFPYNVSKAGINGLVKALTMDWSPDIRISGLAPGFIETQGSVDWFNSFSDPEKKRRDVENIHPAGKIGTPEEVGAFCAFLCSPYGAFMCGTTHLMDGGRSAVMQDV